MHHTEDYSIFYQNSQEREKICGEFYQNSILIRRPLQIVSIPENNRLRPSGFCRLVHYESGLKLSGQFTHKETKEILETTKHCDFELDKTRVPRCRDRLLTLLEKVCNRHLSSKEEAA